MHSDKDLRYSSLCKWSQDNKITLFKLNNLEENLELKRGEDHTIYVIRGDFTKKEYSQVNNLKWLKTPHLESCIISDGLTLPFLNTKDPSPPMLCLTLVCLKWPTST